jgi:hypothetical protein
VIWSIEARSASYGMTYIQKTIRYSVYLVNMRYSVLRREVRLNLIKDGRSNAALRSGLEGTTSLHVPKCPLSCVFWDSGWQDFFRLGLPRNNFYSFTSCLAKTASCTLSGSNP